MPATFPCPNPACSHSFPQEAVKGAVSLVCPRCGTVFHFGASSPAPAKPAGQPRPPAAPPASPPRRSPSRQPPPTILTPLAAEPAAPLRPSRPAAPRPSPARRSPPSPSAPAAPAAPASIPLAMPVGPVPNSALVFESSPEITVSPARRNRPATRRNTLKRWLVIGPLVLLGIGLAIWLRNWIRDHRSPEQGQEAALHAEQGNFRFDFGSLSAWQRDERVRKEMHVHFGLRRSSPSCVLGLFFKDYKTRAPSDAEMVDVALGKLRGYFGQLEWELKPRDDSNKLGGRPALRLEFQGNDPDSVAMAGECFMLSWRGFGYWFFTWAPNDDDRELGSAEGTLARGRFTLLNLREGWTEQPRALQTLQGKKVPYRLSYPKDVWGPESPQDHDPLADAVLRGDEPDTNHNPVPPSERHASRVAWLKVLVLPRAKSLDDAGKAARDYLMKRQKEEGYPDTRIEPVEHKGAAAEQNTDVGGLRGHLSRLHVINGDNQERFVLMAAFNRDQGVLVLVGDSPWDRRDFWEQEMLTIFRTLKPR